MTQRTVLIMAGGTGGHIFPALTIAMVLRDRGVNVQWLGTAAGMESRVAGRHEIPMNLIAASGLRGKNLRTLLVAPFMILRSLWQAIRIVRRLRPCCVLGMGGYVTGPGGLAAWLTRRPLLIHEQNAVVGFSNRLLAPLAGHVLEAFPGTFRPGGKVRCTGNPVRMEIRRIGETERYRDVENRRLRVLVLGGSLGAASINRVIPRALSRLPAPLQPEIRHQAGRDKLEDTLRDYEQAGLSVTEDGARVVDFIEDMAAAYSWADLVICRAGATTVSEIATAGLASILVPYPHAVDDHQHANARWLSREKAAVIVRQGEFDVETVEGLLMQFIEDRAALAAMGHAARTLARPDAGDQVASLCMEVCDAHG